MHRRENNGQCQLLFQNQVPYLCCGNSQSQENFLLPKTPSYVKQQQEFFSQNIEKISLKRYARSKRSLIYDLQMEGKKNWENMNIQRTFHDQSQLRSCKSTEGLKKKSLFSQFKSPQKRKIDPTNYSWRKQMIESRVIPSFPRPSQNSQNEKTMKSTATFQTSVYRKGLRNEQLQRGKVSSNGGIKMVTENSENNEQHELSFYLETDYFKQFSIKQVLSEGDNETQAQFQKICQLPQLKQGNDNMQKSLCNPLTFRKYSEK